MHSHIDLASKSWPQDYREGPNGAVAEWPGKCEWSVGGSLTIVMQQSLNRS